MSVREAIDARPRRELAAELGVTEMTIGRWRAADEVPLRQVIPFCKATGMRPGAVNRDLRDVLAWL